MSEVTSSVARCGDCGELLAEGPAAGPPPACPKCGSSRRNIEISLSGSVTPRSMLGTKLKRQGKGQAVREDKHGADFHKATGKWNHLDRIVDRENDRYYERIVDRETGKVIRECDEPLSEHTGRGSAKKR